MAETSIEWATARAEHILEAAIRIEITRLENLMNAIGRGQSYAETVIDIGAMKDELDAALVASYSGDGSGRDQFPEVKP